MSSLRGEVPEWDFDFSVGVPDGMPAQKLSEGPNIGSNFRRMNQRHARGCIFQDYLNNGSFNKVVGSRLFNHLQFRLIGMMLNDLPQIVFRRTSVRAICGYPAISLCGQIIIRGGKPRDVNKTAAARDISVGTFIKSPAMLFLLRARLLPVDGSQPKKHDSSYVLMLLNQKQARIIPICSFGWFIEKLADDN